MRCKILPLGYISRRLSTHYTLIDPVTIDEYDPNLWKCWLPRNRKIFLYNKSHNVMNYNLSEETIKIVEQDTGMSIHELRTTPIKELLNNDQALSHGYISKNALCCNR